MAGKILNHNGEALTTVLLNWYFIFIDLPSKYLFWCTQIGSFFQLWLEQGTLLLVRVFVCLFCLCLLYFAFASGSSYCRDSWLVKTLEKVNVEFSVLNETSIPCPLDGSGDIVKEGASLAMSEQEGRRGVCVESWNLIFWTWQEQGTHAFSSWSCQTRAVGDPGLSTFPQGWSRVWTTRVLVDQPIDEAEAFWSNPFPKATPLNTVIMSKGSSRPYTLGFTINP